MKTICLAVLLGFCLFSTAQTKLRTLTKERFGSVLCENSQIIDLEKNDTTSYFKLSFRNNRYTYLEEKSNIYLSTAQENSEVKDFVKDLLAAAAIANNGEIVIWDRQNYKIKTTNYEDILLIEPERTGKGITNITDRIAKKICSWLNKQIGEKAN